MNDLKEYSLGKFTSVGNIIGVFNIPGQTSNKMVECMGPSFEVTSDEADYIATKLLGGELAEVPGISGKFHLGAVVSAGLAREASTNQFKLELTLANGRVLSVHNELKSALLKILLDLGAESKVNGSIKAQINAALKFEKPTEDEIEVETDSPSGDDEDELDINTEDDSAAKALAEQEAADKLAAEAKAKEAADAQAKAKADKAATSKS